MKGKITLRKGEITAMNYEKAYYFLFNQISDLLRQLKALQKGKEEINIELCLQTIQIQAEEYCISDET